MDPKKGRHRSHPARQQQQPTACVAAKDIGDPIFPAYTVQAPSETSDDERSRHGAVCWTLACAPAGGLRVRARPIAFTDHPKHG